MLIKNSIDSCDTCKHYRPIEQAADSEDYKFASAVAVGEYGKCTRYPPVFFYQGLVNAEFPVVKGEEVCGEYQPTIK
jgi:hypothetical protein